MVKEIDDPRRHFHVFCEINKHFAAFGRNYVDFNSVAGFKYSAFLDELMRFKTHQKLVNTAVPGSFHFNNSRNSCWSFDICSNSGVMTSSSFKRMYFERAGLWPTVDIPIMTLPLFMTEGTMMSPISSTLLTSFPFSPAMEAIFSFRRESFVAGIVIKAFFMNWRISVSFRSLTFIS